MGGPCVHHPGRLIPHSLAQVHPNAFQSSKQWTSPTYFLSQDIRPVLLSHSRMRWCLSAFVRVKETATHDVGGLPLNCTSLFSISVACRSMQHIVIRKHNEDLHAAIEAAAADEEIAKLARIANQARETSTQAGRSSNACLS